MVASKARRLGFIARTLPLSFFISLSHSHFIFCTSAKREMEREKERKKALSFLVLSSTASRRRRRPCQPTLSFQLFVEKSWTTVPSRSKKGTFDLRNRGRTGRLSFSPATGECWRGWGKGGLLLQPAFYLSNGDDDSTWLTADKLDPLLKIGWHLPANADVDVDGPGPGSGSSSPSRFPSIIHSLAFLFALTEKAQNKTMRDSRFATIIRRCLSLIGPKQGSYKSWDCFLLDWEASTC